MPMNRRHFAAAFGATLASALASGTRSAFAQAAFPSKPIRLLVPYAAGGGTDAIARLVAAGLGEKLGQVVIVDNNGAAGGNIATQQAATASPDGYTMLMANQGPMVVNPHLFSNLKVDTLKAFDPVTLITAAPLVVVVPKASPYKTVQELVAHAQKNPGKLTYGSAGNGSASHLATVLLADMAKFDAIHVPYKGAGPAINDLLGGRTHFMVTTVPSAVGLIDSGDLRVLAVTGRERSPKFPNVPTVAEAGWKGYESTAWYGFVVPKGTPAPVVQRLREATVEAIKAGAVRERLEKEGASPIGSNGEEFASMMAQESVRMAQLIKTASISVD